MVKEQINKVVFGKSQPSRKISENGVPLVVTYRPKVKKHGKLITDLLPFLYSDEKFKRFSHLLQWFHTEALEK